MAFFSVILANFFYSFFGDSWVGNVRKNYYASQNLFIDEAIFVAKKGDFLIDDRYTIEVGGKNKDFLKESAKHKKQIKDIPNSFLALDDIEIGFGAKIPLWLFGFLY
jgi:hypothetical protein